MDRAIHDIDLPHISLGLKQLLGSVFFLLESLNLLNKPWLILGCLFVTCDIDLILILRFNIDTEEQGSYVPFLEYYTALLFSKSWFCHSEFVLCI